MRYAVIIPAAGSGSRMGAAVPKVLLHCDEERALSILRLTVTRFHDEPDCERVVVCVPEAWKEAFASDLAGLPKTRIVLGGSSRQESVYNGLQALADEERRDMDTVVLVHDAARCCVTPDVIRRVVDGVARHGAVTAAVPVVDSLCRAEDATIQGYVDRERVWAIQTPQGALLGELVEAHRQAKEAEIEALDDAGLVARIRPVQVVEGDRMNIKVTQPGDLEIARLVLRGRSA